MSALCSLRNPGSRVCRFIGVVAIVASACTTTGGPGSDKNVTHPLKIEEIPERFDTLSAPAARVRAILDWCDHLAKDPARASDYERVLLVHLDSAMGQVVIAGNAQLAQECEERTAALLNRALTFPGMQGPGGVGTKTAVLLLGYWNEAGLLAERGQTLRTGALPPYYSEKARQYLLGLIESFDAAAVDSEMGTGAVPPERAPLSSTQSKLILEAYRAWEQGTQLHKHHPYSANFLSSAPQVSGATVKGETWYVESAFQRLVFGSETDARQNQDQELATLRNHVRARKDEDPFWHCLHLFLATRAPEAGKTETDVETAFDDFFARYPESTWGWRLMVQYYVRENMPTRIAAMASRGEALYARLDPETAPDLAVSIAWGLSGASGYPDNFPGVERLRAATAWFARADRQGTVWHNEKVAVLRELALVISTNVEATPEDVRTSIASYIRKVLDDAANVPGLNLSDLRILRNSLKQLTPGG